MLQNQLKNLPNKPGVYQFFGLDNKLLYIGKAKSLKNRIKSYFKLTPQLSPANNLSLRIEKMIQESVNLEYFLVEDENDALILENSLIKQLKPKYNILLRDDKTYPYIYIDLSLDFPRFEITRKIVKGKKIRYFGPFSSSVKDLYNALYLLLPLVQKKNCIKGKKACLFYQIDRCLAPCEYKISKIEYKKIVDEAINLLNDRSQIIKKLKEKMYKYSELENYEEAGILRDQIKNIENLSQITRMDFANLEDFDLFAVEIEESLACAVRLFIRNGKVITSSYSFSHLNQGGYSEKNEIYKQMILDFYSQNPVMMVKTILVAHSFDDINPIQSYLRKIYARNIQIKNPKIGNKKRLCDLAILNAKELIKKHKAKSSINFLKTIQEDFEFENFPASIEIFDNSHLSKEASVGSIVSWEKDEFNKKKYRHYYLDSTDEYSQMREILINRAKRFHKEPPPDLWVIDGGKTLLSLAKDIIQSNGVNIDLIAIAKEKIDSKAHRAKGKANDKLHTLKFDFALPSSDKRLHFFQRLRDEAHRFAISFHRKTKRRMDMEKSNLLSKGLNQGQIKKLIDYFGSFEKIQNASFEEINQILGKVATKKLFP